MTDENIDAGVIQAVLDRFNNQRLPRALELKQKVDRGEVLNDLDIHFLEEVFAGFAEGRSLLERHPEYEPLIAQVISLYKEITEKALENQEKAQ